MKIIILSTETLHHIYFINSVALRFKIEAVVLETDKTTFPYDTLSPYTEKEKEFEMENFKTPPKIDSSLPVHRINNVNTDKFTEIADYYKPDLAIVFGCGIISSKTLSSFRKDMINIHRGIINRYRGLDSELWAIFHNDFENVGVALHYIDTTLDGGDVIDMRYIHYLPEDRIYTLRYKTTIMATDMVIEAIPAIKNGTIKPVKQKKFGDYYSAMPSVLKGVCESKFERYIKG